MSIDLIFGSFNHYTRLLLGTTVAGSTTMPPWETVFQVAWIPDESAMRRVLQAVRDKDRERMDRLVGRAAGETSSA